MEDSALILARLEDYIRDREAYYLERLAMLSKIPGTETQRQNVMLVANTLTSMTEQAEKIRESLKPKRLPVVQRLFAIFR